MKHLHRHVSSHHSFMYVWIVGAALVFGGLIWSYVGSHPTGIIDGQHEGDVRSTVAAFGNQMSSVSRLSPHVTDEIRAAYGPYASEALLAAWVANPERAPGRDTSSPSPDHIEVDQVTLNATGSYDVSGRIVLVTSAGDAGSLPVFLTVANTEHGYRITDYTEGTGEATPAPGASSRTVTRALGETDAVVQPVAVVEDSRCARDVQCIWKGTVRLSVVVDGIEETLTLEGDPITRDGVSVWLIGVEPYPTATDPIKNEDYRFTFRIETR